MDLQRNIFSFVCYGCLRLTYRGSRFNSCPQKDLASVTDAAHDPPCMVGGFDNPFFRGRKSVIILRSPHLRHMEPFSDLHAFYRADGHNSLGKHGVQLFKHRCSKSWGNSLDAALDDPACAVLFLHTLFQISACFFCCFFIRHIKGIVSNFFRMKFCNLCRSDSFCVGTERNTQSFQKLYGNCSRRHSSNGFSSGGTPAAPVIPESIFGIKGKICMSRTVRVSNISVIPGSLIHISYHERNRSSGCLSFKYSG